MTYMSGRKKRQKALPFLWTGHPYQAVWAHSPEEVPIWDTSRGFPRDTPLMPFTVTRPASDLEVLRALLDDDSWVPSAPPEVGYPRLVRANYTDPALPCGRDQTEKIQASKHAEADILNRLVRLLRKDSPDKWTMNAVLELHAAVGPVNRGGKGDTSLESWLNLARLVKAHMTARNVLDLWGLSAMQEKAESESQEWKREYGMEYNPYGTIASTSSGVPNKRAFLLKMLELASGRIGRVEIVTDADTLNDALLTTTPLYNWVNYRIGDIWEPSAKVAECEACSNLFLPGRRGRYYCDGACRKRKSKSLSTTA